MGFCRICLCKESSRDLFQLQSGNQLNDNGEKQSCEEIMLFCLGIQIFQDEKRRTELCELCYNKLIDFYKFKILALKNDAHLNSIDSNATVNIAVIDDYYIKKEELKENQCSEDESPIDQEDEPYILICTEDIKDEYKPESVSDEDIKSIFKNQFQSTNIHAPKTTGNAPEKKRGRSRKIKVKKVNSKSMARTVCDHCGKEVTNIKQHMVLHLPLKERQTFICYICGLALICKNNMQKHIKRQHFSPKQKCQICGKVVKNMKMHMLVTHNNHNLPYECVLCHHRFISGTSLAYHMNVHTKDRPYQCEQCSGTYTTKVSLSMHIRQVHNKETRFQCQFCSKGFFTKYKLQVHHRTHTKEKPYKCDQCGLGFVRTYTLLKHRRAHDDPRMKICSICHKAFADTTAYEKHMLGHTKEKKYPCRFCEKRFHRSDHRNGHETNVHKQTKIVTIK